MPIHPIDGQSLLRVETNVGGEWVDLESTDYRQKEYKRNQQTEGRRKYVVEPMPGTVYEPEPEPVVTDAAQVPPVDKELDKAIQQDLNKRGLPVVKTFKPKAKITLD